jgi:hypothetical protein
MLPMFVRLISFVPSPYRAFAIPVALLALVLSAGCSDDLPQTVHVEGYVTYNGERLSHGMVRFVPTAMHGEFERRGAVASIDEGGWYEARTFEGKSGLMPGEYGVSVLALKEYKLMLTPEDKPEYAVPPRFADHTTSGLTLDVRPDGPNPLRFDIELSDR